MAEAKRVASIAAALAAFTFLSSFLGLSGRWFFYSPSAAFGFFAGIWGASVLADLVFVTTTCAAAVFAFRASRDSKLMGGVLAALLNWLAYVLSFLALPSSTSGSLGVKDTLQAIQFVAIWGVVGLAFCTFAVPLAALWWDGRGARPAPMLPAEPSA